MKKLLLFLVALWSHFSLLAAPPKSSLQKTQWTYFKQAKADTAVHLRTKIVNLKQAIELNPHNRIGRKASAMLEKIKDLYAQNLHGTWQLVWAGNNWGGAQQDSSYTISINSDSVVFSNPDTTYALPLYVQSIHCSWGGDDIVLSLSFGYYVWNAYLYFPQNKDSQWACIFAPSGCTNNKTVLHLMESGMVCGAYEQYFVRKD